MPTGYTADIYEGKPVTFEQFALGCARGMGALISMRDAGPDAVIPEVFEPDGFYTKALAEAEARLAEYTSWTGDDWRRDRQKAHDDAVAAWQEARTKRKALRSRYSAMLAQVEAWDPPTEEHEGLRNLMISQLRESIRWDCGASDEEGLPMPTLGPWIEHKTRTMEHAHRQVDYYRQQVEDEQERAAARTAWVRSLRESLGGAS